MELDKLYPQDSNRFLLYHKDIQGNELYDYTRTDSKHFFKKENNYDDTWDDQYYAKKVDGTEYIPDNKFIPFQEEYPAYPLTQNGDNVYFPKNNDGDEIWFYKTKTGTVIHSTFLKTLVRKYPKNKSGREIYPIFPYVDTDDQGNDVDYFFESHVESMYAKDENGNFYYPLDTGGNEYIFDKNGYVNKIQNFVDYPVSQNGTIIVPNINGKPYFVSHFKTKVSINDITGSVKIQYYPNDGGGDDRDFETNVKQSVDDQQQQQQNRRLDGKYFYVLSKERNVLHDTLKLENTNLINKNIPPLTNDENVSSKNLNSNNNNNFFKKIKSPIIIVVICLIVIILLMVWGYFTYFFKNPLSNLTK